MHHYKKVILFILLLGLSLTTVVKALRNQNQTQSNNTAQQTDEAELPVVDAGPEYGKGDVKRAAKGGKYNKDSSVVRPELVRVSEVYHWPAGFPAIPTSQSDLIIVGQVLDAKAYLSSDETGVYSEFTIQISEVLKNKTTEPLKNGDTMEVEREGGRVRYPSGHITRFSIVGFGMPRIGHRYVLFIKEDETNSQIITGYGLTAGTVSPLDQTSVVNFNKYQGWEESPFLNEVRVATAADSQSSR